MKYRLLYLAFCIMIFAACKKESQASLAKTNILGTWTYTAYEVKYYDRNSNLMYDATAGSYNLNMYPAIKFSADGSCTSSDPSASAQTYQIKSSGGVDSLIVTSGLNGGSKFQITSITKTQLQLQSIQPGGVFFTNKSQYGTSYYSYTYSTLVKSQ